MAKIYDARVVAGDVYDRSPTQWKETLTAPDIAKNVKLNASEIVRTKESMLAFAGMGARRATPSRRYATSRPGAARNHSLGPDDRARAS